jgi:hypothetical protein
MTRNLTIAELPFWTFLVPAALCFTLTGCGKSSDTPPPVVLSLSLNNPTVTVVQGATPVLVPVVIVAPTETATFQIDGLPDGVEESYRESESNPSGQLMISASSVTPIGSYKPTIVVGSSGQTASLKFQLVVDAP